MYTAAIFLVTFIFIFADLAIPIKAWLTLASVGLARADTGCILVTRVIARLTVLGFIICDGRPLAGLTDYRSDHQQKKQKQTTSGGGQTHVAL